MIEFTKLLQMQFNKMCATGKLFRSSITGEQVWALYIGNFKKKHDPIYRDPESSTHNCNLCKNFIRRYGNIVAIDGNYNIITMFDIEPEEEFMSVVKAISYQLKNNTIANVFFETFDMLKSLPYESCTKNNSVFKLGIDKNVKRYNKIEANKFGVVKDGDIVTFNHLHLYLPKQFVDMSSNSVESIMAEYSDAKSVFERSMVEIPLETLNLVKDLISQNSLLNGQSHLYKIQQIIPLKTEYDSIPLDKRDIWCWVNSYGFKLAKFKNELIGVLCTELAEGKNLNAACLAWNKRVDPKNYMKASAPITQVQIKAAKEFVEKNNYQKSFDRRYATIEDIKASEILHINCSNDNIIKPISIFDNVKPTSTKHKRSEFDGVESVSIEKFMSDILPTCTSIEAYLSNRHIGNMVSLTTSNIENSKPIFKWSNNYSWTFNGNLAGKSEIKEAVKTAGGCVDGVIRFSLIWNDSDGTDNSDLDAWCVQPNNEKIGFNCNFRKDCGNRFSSMFGQLDLDNRQPCGKIAIENIYFVDRSKLKDGIYKFYVNQYANRNSQGFKAEIEFDGQRYVYEYNRAVSGNVMVANVKFDNGVLSIEHILPENNISKDLYGLKTETFHKVNLVCLSPNHWGENNVGNKHYFFMLDGCRCGNPIRSFHIENLIAELAEHRKVLEVLGNTTMIQPSENQLSGIGFNATVRDELILKLQGSFNRTIKITF